MLRPITKLVTTSELLSQLTNPSSATRTGAIRGLRYLGPAGESIVEIATSDQSPFVRLEAMAYLAVTSSDWQESLEQAVLTQPDKELLLYGDYLLRELGVWL